MMFVCDVPIHNCIVFRKWFSLDRFVIDIFTIRPSSVLLVRFDWTHKRRVIWMGQCRTLGRYVTTATTATTACTRNAG